MEIIVAALVKILDPITILVAILVGVGTSRISDVGSRWMAVVGWGMILGVLGEAAITALLKQSGAPPRVGYGTLAAIIACTAQIALATWLFDLWRRRKPDEPKA